MRLAKFYILFILLVLSYGYYKQQSNIRHDRAIAQLQSRMAEEKKLRVDKAKRILARRPSITTQELNKFFTRYNSPLAGSSADFIDAAQVYGLDWRLLPAIAGVESTFETAGNVHDYNPFGYMCSGSPCIFQSYQQGIWTVAQTIGTKGYYSSFRQSGSIFALAKVYNQVYPEKWTQNVEFFMNKL